ncbi:MAG TPA: Slp family lipoprotein [Nitrospiraceae bacterium]|nr:Slp family lipoprotein [Nitrospiraceae bacterium]
MRQIGSLCALLICIVSLSGCASERVIPQDLEQQLDHSVTFAELKESPTTYNGRLVVLGGEVLGAKRLKEGTQLEILQLPLDRAQRPDHERAESQGRFLALEPDFLDPATLTEGTPVTIVGEVTGTTTRRLDETEYNYPTVQVKHLKVWERQPAYAGPAPGPRFGIFGGTGIGFGGRRSGGGVGVGIGF